MAQVQSKQDLEKKIETRAHAVLNAMVKREYANAIVHFDTAMTSLMPAIKLEELWKAIQEKAGPFVEQISTRLAGVEANPVVILLCKFEKGNLDLYVTFDAAANVAGLHVGPEPAETTASKTANASGPPASELPPQPGAETGDRARSLRGTNVARLSSPRDTMRGRTRVPLAPTSAFPPDPQRSGRCRWFGDASSSSCSA
jgi:hypothetical protein